MVAQHGTPIAARFSSGAAPDSRPLSSYSTSTRATHRTSVSFRAGEDPFGAVSRGHSPQDGAGTPPQGLGGEEWRISEESSVYNEAVNGGPSHGIDATIKKRPSFLKSLIRRGSRSSTNLSVTSISSPITTTTPPRLAPLRTTASLISLSSIAQDPSRRNSYASGTNSLRVTSTSRSSFFAIDEDNTTSSTRPPSRATKSLSRASSFNGFAGKKDFGGREQAVGDVEENLPPTQSAKALELLGGAKRVVKGARTSFYTESDRLAGLGLALTTDEPTRRIVPDNARLSVFSGTGTDRSTLYSPIGSDFDGSTRERVPSFASNFPRVSEEEEAYDPANIDVEVASMHVPSSRSYPRPKAPPSAPLPAIPATHRPPPPPPITTTLEAAKSVERDRPSHSSLLPASTRLSLPPVARTTAPNPSPLASHFLVAGLPADPEAWVLVDSASQELPEHSPNAAAPFFRAEVLEQKETRVGIELSKEDRSALNAKIQLKITKLAFPCDAEVVVNPSQPPPTVAFFSFTISSPPSRTASNNPAAAWDAALSSLPSSTTAPQPSAKTFYATCLTVWSLADVKRTASIRAALAGRIRKASRTVKDAARVSARGRKLGEKLARHLHKSLLSDEDGDQTWTATEGETDVGATERDDIAFTASPRSGTSFWLPYAQVFVSEHPVYDILSDSLRISWARYHDDVKSHALAMERVLATPMPPSGEQIRLPVSIDESQQDTVFVTRAPGGLDWHTGAVDSNIPVWPLFKSLHADNLLAIAELAMAPFGRVLFISRHSIMLGIATSFFSHLLELRGWNGMVHATVATRDVRIVLEDPGPFLVAVPSQLRSLALNGLAPEIAVVDLDANLVTCSSPGDALSRGSARVKARRKLEVAAANVGPLFATPTELHEAFPGGRFRPHCEVEVAGVARDAERLVPSWTWNQAAVIGAFLDAITPKTKSGLSRLLPSSSNKRRRPAVVDPAARQLQATVRRQASQFVEGRDQADGKVNRMQGQLAALSKETVAWKTTLETFKTLSDDLRRQAIELRQQLGTEQSESHRLEEHLAATEKARKDAILQLSALEEHRTFLTEDIDRILSDNGLLDTVVGRVEETISRRSSSASRPGTSQSVSSLSDRSSNQFDPDSSTGLQLPNRLASLAERDEDGDEQVRSLGSQSEEDDRLETMRLAVQETLRSIQARLSVVLQDAEDRRQSVATMGTTASTPASTPPDEQPAPSSPPVKFHRPRPFEPKTFRLSPRLAPQRAVSRTLSRNESRVSFSDEEDDSYDSQSFVSAISDGYSSTISLEEQLEATMKVEELLQHGGILASTPSPPPSHPFQSHRRQFSVQSDSIEAPPVELFTRAMSPPQAARRRREDSVDLRLRQKSGKGKLEPERMALWSRDVQEEQRVLRPISPRTFATVKVGRGGQRS